MAVNQAAYQQVKEELNRQGVTLVAVSKTKPAADILALYAAGQRDFGENYVQELAAKAAALPGDIQWHFIGHLQSNKVKYIAPFVQLIHGVDSLKLLKEISRQAVRNNREIHCLLQVHIAREETKFGLDDEELDALIRELQQNPLPGVKIKGLMGMASFSPDAGRVRAEFRHLKQLADAHTGSLPGQPFTILSMGMSADYRLAMEEGSTLVRIGSLLFGARG